MYSTSLQSTSLGEVFFFSFLSLVNSVREFFSTKAPTVYAVLGIIIFSEVLLFSGFLWAFFHFRWGDLDVSSPESMMPYVYITSSLNSASTVVSTLLQRSIKGDFSKADKFAGFIIVAAWIFLYLQGDEYTLYQNGLNDDWFSKMFYIITGLHSLHVCVGITLIMLSVFCYSSEGQNKLEELSVGTYWHFVELVWVFLTLLLFLM